MTTTLFPYVSTFLFALAGGLLAGPLLVSWDKFSGLYLGELKEMFAQLRLGPEYLTMGMRCWGIATVAVVVVFGFYLSMWPIMLGMLGILCFLPKLVTQAMIKRRRNLLRDQLLSALSVITNSVRAGLAIEAAMEIAAQETPDPLARELRQIIGEYRHGRPFADAVESLKRELDLPSFTLFAAAIITNKKRGGAITETLERLRKSLLENQRLERKLSADTANGKMIINILSIFPFFFLLFAYFTNPEGTTLMFNTIPGQIAMLIAIVLIFIGYRLGMKIIDIDF